MSKILIAVMSTTLLLASPLFAQDVPPNSFRGQVWSSPLGCKYTRAGRQGEAIWYLIVNSRKGRDCPLQIVQTPGE